MKTKGTDVANTDDKLISGQHLVLSTALQIASEREHAPLVLLVGDEGVTPISGQYADDAEKDLFVAGVQRIAARTKAHTSVFIHEAWLTTLPAGKSIPTDEEIAHMRNSGALRQEALIVSIERRGKPPMVVSAMIGVEGGLGTRKVGSFELIPGRPMSGRMLDMLGELEIGGETV